MPTRSPEDILQAVYDAALESIRTTSQVVLNGQISVDNVKIVDDDSPLKLKIKKDLNNENAVVVVLNQQPLPQGAATEAKQDALLLKDFAAETTLEAVLAKLIANPATENRQVQLLAKDFATESTLSAIRAKLISAPATEAKQDLLLAKDFATETTLLAMLAKLVDAPATETKQDALLAKDFATEATLSAILAKLIANPATAARQDQLLAKDFATQTTLAQILAKLIANPASESKQDALLAKDFATQTTLAAILAKLIAAPATETKQDALLAKDFATQATLQAVLIKITAAAATESKQDKLINCVAGGVREHRELTVVSTSYVAATNSTSFSSPKRHIRVYCTESVYWVDSAISDADAQAKLGAVNQRGFLEKGGVLRLDLIDGITRFDFLGFDHAAKVYVTGME